MHLYAEGRSKRGPSFRIHDAGIDAVAWDMINTVHLGSQRRKTRGSPSKPCELKRTLGTEERLELFIAAPEDSSREEAFRWHLTTRNFLAWMTKKPLVGRALGGALIDLLHRMQILRPNADNTGDLISYTKELGYMDFTHCPEYALGLLRFAEHYQIKSVWTDAFAHCVGMAEILHSSPEISVSADLVRLSGSC